MRQITLELLRHGPAHNQLLSPLTPYLALCENHSAVTVQVPFEHNQFLYRLRALSYDLGEEPRVFQITDTGRVLGELLGKIPGVIAELNKQVDQPPGGDGIRPAGERLTHVRLIISASELALLPFELAFAPNGAPGAGQYLLLQSQEPICLTREVRRVPEHLVHWPSKPRILFAAAAPPGVGAIPIEAHLLVLRKLIEPWVEHYETEDERRRRIEDHLVFLPDASAEGLAAECARGRFSHVHILAHGVQYPEGYDVRFGLAFHDSTNPEGAMDIVNGDRLATILRAAQSPKADGLARPVVVTLASCNTGNVGTVSGIGASVAHALHQQGVPLVVAGQFPLSAAGSVLMVEALYDGLLWGEDPRVTLIDLRRRLFSQYPKCHDWGSLTAYASFPVEFERELTDVQIHQAMRSINVAMNHADKATELVMKTWRRPRGSSPSGPAQQPQQEALQRARLKIGEAKRRLEGLLDRTEQRARIYGLLASTEKRRAEVYFSFRGDPASRDSDQAESFKSLLQARRHYWSAFLLDPASSWAVVQYLSLDVVLGRLYTPPVDAVEEETGEYNRPETLWTLAHILSLNELKSRIESRVEWAHGNLIELYLLALLLSRVPDMPPPDQLKDYAYRHARDLVNRAGSDSFEVYSTRRQIVRYIDWYSEIANLGDLPQAARGVLDALPEPARQEWD